MENKKEWILLDCVQASLKASMNSEKAMYDFCISKYQAAMIKAEPLRFIVITPEQRYSPYYHATKWMLNYQRELKLNAG